MIVVLDVSAAIEVLLHKEKGELFSSRLNEAAWVVAPDLYVSELSNVLWKYHRAKAVLRPDCVTCVEEGINLIDDFIEGRELWKEALGEAIKNSHSVYDMHYAVLTRRNDAVLLTKDKTLAQLCKKLKIEVCS